MDELRPDSQRVLELAAVAGQPTELSILQLAGGIAEPVLRAMKAFQRFFARERCAP